MVRLLHLRHARRVSGEIFLLQRAGQCRLHLRAACLRRRFCGAPVRRADLRPLRRHDRPQIHLPRHHEPDGYRHLLHRRAAGLRQLGHPRADRADCASSRPGTGARRRIWRSGDLCRRARAGEQARLLHVVDPNHRDARPVHGAALDPRHPHRDGRSRLRRLGLAHSVPAVGGPARGLDLDPAQARRIAAVQAHGRRGQTVEAAVRRKRSANGATPRSRSRRCSAPPPAKRWCGTADSSMRCSS